VKNRVFRPVRLLRKRLARSRGLGRVRRLSC
jgi:hypothetical protein